MRSTLTILALACLATTGAAAAAAASEPERPLPVAHRTRSIEGWTVRVDERLLAGEHAEKGELALKLLAARLLPITLVIEGEVLAKLKEIPIQLDLTHGKLRVAQYHPSAGWLRDNGYSEELVKCVHIPEVEHFISRWENQRMPWVVLHELAHGYHDRVLGFEEARIEAVWAKWKEGRGEGIVLMSNGTRRPHYGLTNPKEFFAEMTESYLGQNDFFPFNAGELKEDAPEVFALMAEIWGRLPRR